MRRVILSVVGTVAGLVALLSFKSHVPTVPSASAATTGGSGGTSAAPSSSPSTVPGEYPEGSATLTTGETAITGHVANTVYGPVQIQLIMRNHKIVKVAVLEQIKETLAAQTAKIDSVSGASYTSAGYIQSLQSALDKDA
jgi:hypothetical protein